MKEIIITDNDAGQRLDRFLRKYLNKLPLSGIYRLIRKDIKLNGRRAKEDSILEKGDVLCIYMPDELISEFSRRQKPNRAKKQFTICYEDDNILVVSKPFGLLVHGDETEKKNTLANQVISYLIENGSYVPRMEKSFTPSPVHRLDRNTTGLVLFGKNAAALRAMSSMFAEKGSGVRKFYNTICFGEIKDALDLQGWLIKDEVRNRVKIVSGKTGSPGEKFVRTIVRPMENRDGFCLAEAELITGRSHQIRAQLACCGHPLLGDVKYCSRAQSELALRRFGETTQLLHAVRMEFVSCPDGFEYLNGTTVTAPLSIGFKQAVCAVFDRETE